MESSNQSFILPAIRAQWLVSTMSYAYGISHPPLNEVVVLATGLDQYLQELFHHLDFTGDEHITKDDFVTLLNVLDLQYCNDEGVHEDNVTDGSCKMDFKTFHRQLVQSFLEDNGEDSLKERKEWNFQGELVEAEVQMTHRQGHSIRTMCSECFCKKPVSEIFHSVIYKQGKHSGDDGDSNPVVTEDIAQQKQTSVHAAQLQEENEGLRELVEDMRQALQSSDAKNLALEVSLRNRRSVDKTHNSSYLEHGQTKHEDNLLADSKYLTRTVLMNELNRLQDKRNMQLEEAMLYSQELEADLWRSRKDQETLQKARTTLLQNQQVIVAQLEKARQLLGEGLQRVKMLEEQEVKIEELQMRLKVVQSTISDEGCRKQCCSPLRRKNNVIPKETSDPELLQCRELDPTSMFTDRIPDPGTAGRSSPTGSSSSRSNRSGSGGISVRIPDPGTGDSSSPTGSSSSNRSGSGGISDRIADPGTAERASPTGSSSSSSRSNRSGSDGISVEVSTSAVPQYAEGDGEDMIRAAEGQEASDNKTEERKQSDSSSTTHCCENGSDTVRRAKVSEMQAKMDKLRKQLQDTIKEKEDIKNKHEQERFETLSELDQKKHEMERFQKEIQRIESERVRLSLVENTVKDIMSLLRKLKELHLSRRSIGKIIMDTLEMCVTDNNMKRDPDGEVKRFLTCFHKQLQHHNLLLQTKATQPNEPLTSKPPHNALHVSSHRMASSSSEAYFHRGRSSSMNSIQVKTNFYQYGTIQAGIKGNHLPTTFKAIKTELGTV